MDARFGKGERRALCRHGIWQGQFRKDGSRKIRGIDDARKSEHNTAAAMSATIRTASADFAIQLLHWIASHPDDSVSLQSLRVCMRSDDLDAYHGVRNHPGQLGFCAVAIRDIKTNVTEFVNNFNRPPELLTAIARRIGGASAWQFSDDHGYLDLAPESGIELGAQQFAQQLYKLLGRPLQAERSVSVCFRCQHLGRVDEFERWQSHSAVSLTPRDGEIQQFLGRGKVSSNIGVSLEEVQSLTGGLFFLSSFCYHRASGGGYRAMCDFLAKPGQWYTDPLAEYPPKASIGSAARRDKAGHAGQRLFHVADSLWFALRFFMLIL